MFLSPGSVVRNARNGRCLGNFLEKPGSYLCRRLQPAIRAAGAAFFCRREEPARAVCQGILVVACPETPGTLTFGRYHRLLGKGV